MHLMTLLELSELCSGSLSQVEIGVLVAVVNYAT